MRRYQLHSISSAEPARFSLQSYQFALLNKASGSHHLMFDDGYEEIFEHLIPIKINLNQRVTVFPVVQYVGKVNTWDSKGELCEKRLLSWEELKQLFNRGIEIGSHTFTHPDLTKLSSRDLDFELQESKRVLEENLEIKIEGLAYPYGFWNERVIEAVKKAGYRWAVTTSDSIWEGRGNPFRQRRIEIKGTDSEWLVRLKMSWLYDVKGFWELPGLLWEKLGQKKPARL